MHYTAANYWSPAVWPREKLRQPYPAAPRRRVLIETFGPGGSVLLVAAHCMIAGAGPRFVFVGRGAARKYVAGAIGAKPRFDDSNGGASGR